MTLQSQIISKIVAPAMQLWLRSQVEQVKALQVRVEGGDRQILAGQICRVSVSAQHAVYQGLHLSQIDLVGHNIWINLKQVLQGQPLRLLDAVPVEVKLRLQAADLTASLQAPLLATAISEFLLPLLPVAGLGNLVAPESAVQSIRLQQIAIDPGQLTLSVKVVPINGKPISLILQTGLQLASTRELHLNHPQWLSSPWRGLPLNDLNDLKLDLGSEVAIQELRLEVGELTCRGQLNVLPFVH